MDVQSFTKAPLSSWLSASGLMNPHGGSGRTLDYPVLSESSLAFSAVLDTEWFLLFDF